MQRIATLITGILTTSTIITGSILLSTIVSADDSTEDEVSITVPVSCTLSGTGMNTHNAEIANGLYNSAIGETTLKALCNDNEGFAIYAIGYTDNEAGKNVLTNSTLGSTADIVTGTAISGNTSNWAMKLTAISSPTPTYPIIVAGSASDSLKEQGDPDFTTFQEVPDDYKKVAYRTAATDIGTNAEGSSVKTTYQAYISPTQPAGTYTGQVKYTLVHPYDTTAPLSCKPGGTTISTIVCMQDINAANKSAILSSMIEGAQYTLVDIRDEKQYYVAKLADGNIWMTQNLDLDLSVGTILTSADTDLPSGITWTPAASTKKGTNTTWDDYQYTPESYDPGELYWNETLNTTHADPNDYISTSGNNHYKLGNYYNWNAAVATNDTSTILQQDYYLVDQSICPAGWTLPRPGTGEDSFYSLWNEYGFSSVSTDGNNSLWTSPLYFMLSGEATYSNNSMFFNGLAAMGIYWTSVVGDAEYEYPAISYLSYTTSVPIVSSTSFSGYTIRCIARPVTNIIQGL